VSELFSQGYAVVIGVGADLPSTVDDAVGLAAFLQDLARCAYPEEQVNLLTSETATRVNILGILEKLAAQSSPESTVLFYFSGHGYQVDSTIGQMYYLMPYGYDVKRLYQTSVSGAELTERLRAIPAKKMLVLLDCCHAGGLDSAKEPGLENVALAKAPLPPEAQSLLAQGSGRVLIASSTADELSYAGKPYSAFTLALVEALAGMGAAKQDGHVRVADLALYAREKVPQRTNDKQHPILNFEQADNFIIAYYAGGDRQPKALPFTTTPEIEPEPGAFARIDQRGQMIHGSQTNIGGNAEGPVVSGAFHGPVRTGGNDTDTTNTEGGAYIGGSVNTGGGELIGRDKTVHGDDIRIGNMTGNTGVAIGRGARANVIQGASRGELERVFADLLKAVQQGASLEQQADVVQMVHSLKEEASKGEQVDDNRMAKLIDSLVGLAPSAASAVVSAFASPLLAGIAGPVTKFMLNRIQGK